MTSPLPIAGDQFTRQDPCRILRVSDRQLGIWQRKGLVPDADAYNFSDLLTLKTISELRKNHVPIKRIQRDRRHGQPQGREVRPCSTPEETYRREPHADSQERHFVWRPPSLRGVRGGMSLRAWSMGEPDRKSTRLNSSH